MKKLSPIILAAASIFGLTRISHAEAETSLDFLEIIHETVYTNDSTVCSHSPTSLSCHGQLKMELNMDWIDQQTEVYDFIAVSRFGLINAEKPLKGRNVFFHNSINAELTLSKTTTAVHINYLLQANVNFCDVERADAKLSIFHVAKVNLMCQRRDGKTQTLDGNLDSSSLTVYESMIVSIEDGVSFGTITVWESQIGWYSDGPMSREIFLVAREISITSSTVAHLTRARADVIHIDNCTIELSVLNFEAGELQVVNSRLVSEPRSGNSSVHVLENIALSVGVLYFENNHFHQFVDPLFFSGNRGVFVGNTFNCDCAMAENLFDKVGEENYCDVDGTIMTVNAYKRLKC